MRKVKITPREVAALRSSAPVKAAVKAFRRQCEAVDAPCWLCGGKIDYQAEKNFPYAFEASHAYPLAQLPEWAADPEALRPSHHECNRRRGGNLSKGPEAPDLGTTSQEWQGMTDLSAGRPRPGAARRKLSWYIAHDLDPEDDKALAEFNTRRFSDEGEDDEPVRYGHGHRRPAARSGYSEPEDDDGEFDTGFLFI